MTDPRNLPAPGASCLPTGTTDPQGRGAFALRFGMMALQARGSVDIGIAICGLLSMLVCWGVTYSMPVMFPFLAQHWGVPVWHFAAYFSIGGAICFSLGGPAGALSDRYGAAIVVAIGMVLSALGFLLAGAADREWLFAIGYILGISAAVGAANTPVAAAVQVLSSPERKIVTAGITSSGIGFGAMLVPPVIAWLYQATDWRSALYSLAGLALVGILPLLALRGTVTKAPPPAGVSALRSNPNFVWAFAGQMLFAIMFFVPFAHLVSIVLWRGWDATEGVELISLLGLGSTAGRFLLTPLARLLGASRTAFLCATITALAMFGIALAPTHWVIWVNVGLFGLTYGAVIALSAPLVAEICGERDFGRNLGTLMSARSVGILVGPWSVGVTQWWIGSYTAPLVVCALIGLLAALCFERAGWRQLSHLGLQPDN